MAEEIGAKLLEEGEPWEDEAGAEGRRILNLTQHAATPEQLAAGVFEPTPEDKARIRKLLTFDELPTAAELYDRAWELTNIADKYGVEYAMIGGAPYLMRPLEETLLERGIVPLYAFSKREVVEERLPDGTVRKVTKFKHLGFVEVGG